MSGGIYCIRHADGRVYVGSAVNIRGRWRGHRSELNRGIHLSRRLQNAWTKYGATAFVFDVLEVVTDRTALTDREQHWIDTLRASEKPNFNLRPNARTQLGFKHTAEVRERISKSLIGREFSAETRAKITAAITGRKLSAAQCAGMSAAMLGKKQSPAARLKMSISRTGKPLSAAHRASIGLGNKGKVRSPEDCAQKSARMLGKPRAPRKSKPAMEITHA